MQTIGVFEAKTKLSSLLDRVNKGESFTITRHGKPAAVLIKPMDSPFPNAGKAIAEIMEFSKKFADAFQNIDMAELTRENREDLENRYLRCSLRS
jgi:prevent-host-death family protein